MIIEEREGARHSDTCCDHKKKKRLENKVYGGVGEGGASAGPCQGIPFPKGPDPHTGIVQNRAYSGHGTRVKGVVEAEKGRERERVEKQRQAMTMWRKGEGRRAQEGQERS